MLNRFSNSNNKLMVAATCGVPFSERAMPVVLCRTVPEAEKRSLLHKLFLPASVRLQYPEVDNSSRMMTLVVNNRHLAMYEIDTLWIRCIFIETHLEYKRVKPITVNTAKLLGVHERGVTSCFILHLDTRCFFIADLRYQALLGGLDTVIARRSPLGEFFSNLLGFATCIL